MAHPIHPNTTIPAFIKTVTESGRNICLRPLQRSDRDNIEQGIAELSDRSRYLRFFSVFRTAPASVVESLSAVDGYNHIAWGVVDLDAQGDPGIAAAHVIRDKESLQTGEFAIAILDDYHGLGIARLLMAAIFSDCILHQFTALRMEILNENKSAIGLITAVGGTLISQEGPVGRYKLDPHAVLAALKAMNDPSGLQDIFRAFNK